MEDKSLVLWERRLSAKELSVFCKQLAMMQDAGVSLIDCLFTLAQNQHNTSFAKNLQAVTQGIRQGYSLSDMSERYPKSFPTLFVRMIRSAENGGGMQKVLNNLSDYYNKQHELKSKVINVFTYPLIVTLIAIGVMLFLVTTVIPIFVDIIESMGMVMPLSTRILLMIGAFISAFWPVILIILLIIIGTCYFLKRTKWRAEQRGQLILRIPIIGRLALDMEMIRIADSLAILIGNGLDMLNALEVTADVVANEHIRRLIQDAQKGIRCGNRLSDEIEQTGGFDMTFIQMIRVGEQSGTYESVFNKISAYYHDEYERLITSLTTILEPLVLLIVGLIVMFIVLSVMTPIYNIYEGYLNIS